MTAAVQTATPHAPFAQTTVREARDAYFAASGFDESSYTDDWVDLAVGPIPLRFPNTSGRQRAVPLHDLHHALTGYSSDFRGEFQIAAFEIGGGMGRAWAGWFLNLLGLSAGVVLAPRKTFRAFVRGRRSENLYRRPPAPGMLDRDADAVRAERGITDAPPARAGDLAAFVGWAAAAQVVGVVGLLSAPAMLALGVWGARRGQNRNG